MKCEIRYIDFANGDRFAVGMPVVANRNSIYEGLSGTVIDLRYQNDYLNECKEKEIPPTDSNNLEIHCAFNWPKSESFRFELENRFTKLYGTKKKLEEIGLDDVIMAPDMLEPLMKYQISPREDMYVLIRTIDTFYNTYSVALAASQNINVLREKMMADIDIQKMELLKEMPYELVDVEYKFWKAVWHDSQSLTYSIETVPILFGKQEV